MERAYREDELLDSVVIDSEGYIYGKVAKIDIKEDTIDLLVYETKPDERTVVNLDAVKEELLERVKLTFTAKLQRLSRPELLARNIKEEFDLVHDEPLTEQHYIRYAERSGIEIPHTKAREGRKEPKGIVNLDNVKTIGIATIGTGERSSVIKVILLNEPKEAEFRKIPVQKNVPYRSTKMIRDKLVVDSSGLAVGYADSVVLFSNSPGIRIYSSKPTDSIKLSWLFLHLEKIGRPDIIEAMKKYFEIEKGTFVYRVMMEDIEEFMRNSKITFKVPEKLVLDRSVKEFLMDIPWDTVHKVGDVVLLGTKLSELKSEFSRRHL